jgi:hypothetical protein
VRKWLRQQSHDIFAAGFDALVKRWDKCINVGGGYVEKYKFFFSRFEYHMFYVLYPFVTYLLTLPRIPNGSGPDSTSVRQTGGGKIVPPSPKYWGTFMPLRNIKGLSLRHYNDKATV